MNTSGPYDGVLDTERSVGLMPWVLPWLSRNLHKNMKCYGTLIQTQTPPRNQIFRFYILHCL